MTASDRTSGYVPETVSKDRFERERLARIHAETLLEEKSRELYRSIVGLEIELDRERQMLRLMTDFIEAFTQQIEWPLDMANATIARIRSHLSVNDSPWIDRRCKLVEDLLLQLSVINCEGAARAKSVRARQ